VVKTCEASQAKLARKTTFWRDSPPRERFALGQRVPFVAFAEPMTSARAWRGADVHFCAASDWAVAGRGPWHARGAAMELWRGRPDFADAPTE
jgi:hypothetical protein